MTFLQEKIAKIPSDGYHKVMSPVATTHIVGISSVYKSITEDAFDSEEPDPNI